MAGAPLLDGRAQASGVQDYRWKKRILLVFAPTSADPRLLDQKAVLQTLTRSQDDRDLVLVSVSGEASSPGAGSPNDLRRRYEVRPDAFVVILIGKDGGLKIRSVEPLSAYTLTSVIDAMPMGAEERRSRLKTRSAPPTSSSTPPTG